MIRIIFKILLLLFILDQIQLDQIQFSQSFVWADSASPVPTSSPTSSSAPACMQTCELSAFNGKGQLQQHCANASLIIQSLVFDSLLITLYSSALVACTVACATQNPAS